MTAGLLIVAIFAAAYAMVANRLSSTVLTAPILFLGCGYLLSQTGILPLNLMNDSLHLVAEVALIVLLFLDAAQTDLDELRKRFVWPARMLLIGFPLCLLLGTIFAWIFLPAWPLVALALIAAILAPTDAALGQAVVTNLSIPERERRALTVESGLNDGLALPAILLFASLTASVMHGDETNWLLFGAMQLVLGPLAGLVVGILGGRILLWAKAGNHTAEAYEGVGALALACSAYLAANLIGGNGFIAAFVAGLSFGGIVKDRCKFVFEFTENEGQGLVWTAFLLIGMLLLPTALEHLDLTSAGIILTSLFIVRPLAIWISLIGTDASPVTRLFFGWFGPRGLATALFALMIFHEIGEDIGEYVLNLAVNAVWISALLHGLTSVLGAKWYASSLSRKK